MLGVQGLKEKAIVRVGIHFAQDGLNLALRSYDKRGSLGSKTFPFATFRRVHPYAIGTNNLFAAVTDEREWQGVEFDEIPVALRGIDADPEQGGVGAKLRPRITKLTCLSGASRRLVLRIEVKNKLFPNVVRQVEDLAISEFASNSDPRKVWSGVTSAQGSRAHNTHLRKREQN